MVVKRTVGPDGETTGLEHVGDDVGTCHFLHKVIAEPKHKDAFTLFVQDEETVAALSLCSGQDVHGVVFSGDR